MNNITIIGTIASDLSAGYKKNAAAENTLVHFKLLDRGNPYQNSNKEPIIFDVYFSKEAAASISHFMVKDKELAVTGCIQKKRNGDEYVYADKILFTGKSPKKEAAECLR